MTTTLNWVDYVIIGLFAFSALAGLFRGLISEVIGCVTWVSAFVIAAFFATDLAARFTNASDHDTISLLAITISFIFLFIITLIVGSVINYLVSRMVDMGGVSISNRILGGVFGFIRGFLINFVIIFL